MGITLAASLVSSISFGYLPFYQIINVIRMADYSAIEFIVLTEIRLPRSFLALFIGASLGLAGLLAQGAFANPLAEPAIIGASSGAAVGSIVALTLGLASFGGVATLAVVSALGLSLATFYLARIPNQSNNYLILVIGIAISAFGIALVGIISSFAGRSGSRSITFWYFGSLSLANWDYVIFISGILLISAIAIYSFMPKLDLLSFGDIQVRHWGISPNKVRFTAIVAMAILTAASVSAVGNIAFLGLAAPHIARSIFGSRHQILMIPSMMIGATVLLISDTLARNLASSIELPLGFFTALVGAPILILLARNFAKDVSHD